MHRLYKWRETKAIFVASKRNFLESLKNKWTVNKRVCIYRGQYVGQHMLETTMCCHYEAGHHLKSIAADVESTHDDLHGPQIQGQLGT